MYKAVVMAMGLMFAGSECFGDEIVSAASGIWQKNQNPTVVYSSRRNTYLVVWEDVRTRKVPGYCDAMLRRLRRCYRWGSDLHGHVIDEKGNKVGARIVFWNTWSEKRNPVMAYNWQHDEIMMAWEDRTVGFNGNGRSKIYVQRLTSDGRRIGSSILIAEGGEGWENPKLAFNSYYDEYLLTFERSEKDNKYAIYGNRLYANGRKKYSNPLRITSGQADERAADLVYASRSLRYCLVYEQKKGTDSNIMGKLLYTNGREAASFSVAVSERQERNPVVTYNYDLDQYLITWVSQYSSTDDDVHARIVGNHGRYMSSKIIIAGGGRNENEPVSAYYKWTVPRTEREYCDAYRRMEGNCPEGKAIHEEYIVLYRMDSQLYGTSVRATGRTGEARRIIRGSDTTYDHEANLISGAPHASVRYPGSALVIWKHFDWSSNDYTTEVRSKSLPLP